MKTLTTTPALGTNIRRTGKNVSAVFTVTAIEEDGTIYLTNDEFGHSPFTLDQINSRINTGSFEVLTETAGIIDTVVFTSETGLQAIANTRADKKTFVKYIYPFSDEVAGEEDDQDEIGRLVTLVQAWAGEKGYIVWSY